MTSSPKILTVTLNPAIDVATSVAELTHELKLRCAAVQRDPGGGGVNVARVLARFDVDCRALYMAGGFLGRLLQRLLAQDGVRSIPIEVDAETRESFTVLERSSGREFRFVLPGPSLEASDWRACLDRVAAIEPVPDWLVASGSLPPGAPDDFYARLARIAREQGSRMVLDASGPALAAALEEGVHFVKPNLREMRELTGEPLETEDSWVSAAARIVDEGKAEIVALTLGHRGALLVADGRRLRAEAIPVAIAGTVGAGDSFVASFLARLAVGAGIDEAFRYGVAGGTAALLEAGTSLASPDEVERLARLVELRET